MKTLILDELVADIRYWPRSSVNRYVLIRSLRPRTSLPVSHVPQGTRVPRPPTCEWGALRATPRRGAAGGVSCTGMRMIKQFPEMIKA